MPQSELSDGAIREGEPPMSAARPFFRPSNGSDITRKAIDKLGVLSYAPLVTGCINVVIDECCSPETRNSWPVLAPLLLANAVGVLALFYCLFYFLRHLLNPNHRMSVIGKCVWFVLLLLGHMLTIPIYWYIYIVRDHVVGEVDGPLDQSVLARDDERRL
jgi:hypothetical protein